MNAETRTNSPAAPVVNPIRLPDFRLLWLGATSISLAVQFYAVALVWLALEVTGSGIALGTLLTMAAVPRAISMLVSGALIDRYPPRRLMLIASTFSAALVGLIALLLGIDQMSVLALFIIAPLTGLMDSLFYPATYALLPRLVHKSQLASANAIMQIADTIANIAGPAFGGLIIGQIGLEFSFLVNALLFVIGGSIIWQMSRNTDRPAIESPTDKEPFGKSVWNGIRYAFSKPPIRISLLLVALLNFAAIGPIVVGGVLLIERRFGGGATEYGIMSGAFGVGSLVGMILLTLLGTRIKRPGLTLVYTAFVLAGGLAGLGFASEYWMVLLIAFIIGIFGAITNINAVTWLQLNTEMHMQGRIASLLVFSAIALDPFSNGISGIVAEINLPLLFVSAGVLVAFGGLTALMSRSIYQQVAHE